MPGDSAGSATASSAASAVVRADFAIVTKPGFAVQWEEVGVCWFRVRVHGLQSYVGRKHVLAEDSAIAKAAITGLSRMPRTG